MRIAFPWILLVSFAVLPGARAQEDEPGLKEIIDRMESRIAPVRAFRLGIGRDGQRDDSTVECRSDGSVRIRSGSGGTVLLAMTGWNPGAFTLWLDSGGVRIRGEGSGRFDDFDHGFPLWAAHPRRGRWAPDFMLLLWSLSPGLMLAHDDFHLLGRRRIGPEEIYVLRSVQPLEADHDSNGGVWVLPAGGGINLMEDGEGSRVLVKTLWIRAHDLSPIRLEIRHRQTRARWDVVETQQIGGVSIPATIVEGADHDLGRGVEDSTTRIRVRISERGDPGILGEGDCFARSAALDLKTINEELERKPGDIDLLYSRVLSRAGVLGSGSRLRFAPAKAPDFDAIAADLEKVVASGEAPSAVCALLKIYTCMGSLQKRDSLLTRVEKEAGRSGLVSRVAAQLMNDAGWHARALKLIAGIPDPCPLHAAEERIIAHLGLGDLKSAVGTFRAAAASRRDPSSWVRYLSVLASRPSADPAGADDPEIKAAMKLRLPEGLLQNIDRVKLLGFLGAAIQEDPGCPGLRFAKLTLGGDAASAGEALAGTHDPAVVKAAMDLLWERAAAGGPEELRTLHPVLNSISGAPEMEQMTGVLKAMLLFRQGRREEAVSLARKSLESDLPMTGLLRITVLASELGDDPLLEKAACRYLDGLRRSPESQWGMALQAGGDAGSPVRLLADVYHRQQRLGAFYHAMKGVDCGVSGLLPSWNEDLEALRGSIIQAAVREASGNRSELPGLKWLARTLRESGELTGEPDTLTSLYEKARSWDPGDTEILQGSCILRLQEGDFRGASDLLQKLIDLLQKGAPIGTAGWTLNQTWVYLADAQVRSGEERGAAGSLRKVDLERGDLRPADFWRGGLVLERLGSFEEAAGWIARIDIHGYLPDERLGRIFEQAKRYEDAVRHYNRALSIGYDTGVPDPVTASRWVQIKVGGVERPDGPAELRQKLLDRLGPDPFLDRLWKMRLPPMTGDEEKRVRELLEMLSGDRLEDRDRAAAELRTIGVKAAPVLRERLESTDGELRARIHELLMGWAEPR